jgi:hypothetical protein
MKKACRKKKQRGAQQMLALQIDPTVLGVRNKPKPWSLNPQATPCTCFSPYQYFYGSRRVLIFLS